MKSLNENIRYKILKLRIGILKNNDREHKAIHEYGYGEEATKFKQIGWNLNAKLKIIENELRDKYAKLELNSQNLAELNNISSILLEFKDFDASLLLKIESKIPELIIEKEKAITAYNFKRANEIREEINQLQKYFSSHKIYLKV